MHSRCLYPWWRSGRAFAYKLKGQGFESRLGWSSSQVVKGLLMSLYGFKCLSISRLEVSDPSWRKLNTRPPCMRAAVSLMSRDRHARVAIITQRTTYWLTGVSAAVERSLTKSKVRGFESRLERSPIEVVKGLPMRPNGLSMYFCGVGENLRIASLACSATCD